ncbi:hypothetical protein AB0F81_34040 [Actinoplanes sp. NPDC024001]|uniref:hypothetical protein n=1 Tax=Actinoplanes sp. NPDC024001 TaxID=3154598 RepID=UPI0033E26B81
MTSNDDDSQPARRKPLSSSWALTVAAGLFGTYYLVSGALTLREKYGNGLFALVMAAIVTVVSVIAVMLVKTYRTERAARKQ